MVHARGGGEHDELTRQNIQDFMKQLAPLGMTSRGMPIASGPSIASQAHVHPRNGPLHLAHHHMGGGGGGVFTYHHSAGALPLAMAAPATHVALSAMPHAHGALGAHTAVYAHGAGAGGVAG